MKKNGKILVMTGCTLVMGILLTMPVIAEPMHEKKGSHHGDMSGKTEGHKKKSSKSHLFSKHWAKTLDDQQKIDVDTMHLELVKQQNIYKAELKLREAELNGLVVEDKTDLKKIKAKIAAVVALKEQLMLARFVHIAEMRARLNAEQRISYDMGVLKRDPKKH